VVVVPPNGVALAAPFLDVSARLVPLGIAGPGTFDERGLIGFAIHPGFAGNGKVYSYTSEPLAGPADFTVPLLPGESFDNQGVIAEWTVSAGDPNVVDPLTRRELIRIDDPQFNHNGGAMHFGPDGFLYIPIGDGGNADDEGAGHAANGNAQELDRVFGKILRIDVDGTNSANGAYGIPATNPFVAAPGLDEIWAYGLRNPYSIGFDPLTGDLYAGDAGQNHVEEIDLITAGGNFGWRYKEGSFAFDPNGAGPGFVTTLPPGPIPPGLIDPIAEYDHGDGTAVVGGFVYRGTGIPALQGRYVTGDFTTNFVVPAGRLFHLDAVGDLAELRLGTPQRPLGLFLKGFGQDLQGDVYVLGSTTLGPVGTTGTVQKILPAPDHLLAYKVGIDRTAAPPGTPFSSVTRSIADALGARTCTVKKERSVLNPAEKEGQLPVRNVHYLSHQLSKCPTFVPTARTFTNQISPAGVSVTLVKPSVLLVPAGKSIQPSPTPPAPPVGTNHFLCYKAMAPRLRVTVGVSDQFTSPTPITLTKITQVCSPASLAGDDPGATADQGHYVCYQAKLPMGVKHVRKKVRTNSAAFGANSLESKALKELCVPSSRN
jgi:glucose/arabinose dehydrogenase